MYIYLYIYIRTAPFLRFLIPAELRSNSKGATAGVRKTKDQRQLEFLARGIILSGGGPST
jgi:hypothetical protein